METAARVRVFWQPGCTSCLRTKEFLARQGVDYESINVHGNAAGMEALRELGARSVPIVARGSEFVYAQSLADVVRFLELDIRLHDKLSPQQLVDKLDLVLGAATRYVRQIPADKLEQPFRNRNRPIRMLAHHVFRIPEAFVEAMRERRELSYELIMQPPGDALRTTEDLARYGAGVRAAVRQWWQRYPDSSCGQMMDTYFGRHSVHEVLERSAWHPAQHARQLMLLLEELGIEPDGRLTADDLSGLPLPEKAWDD
ncbi:MAG TPA: glutaredoxin domain-containing protein [Burkholderiales bacterium]|nr:glutaredoxin domain-containing protein [Burkholderiales bacterium]